MEEKFDSFQPQDKHFFIKGLIRIFVGLLISLCIACLGFSIWSNITNETDIKLGSEKAAPILLALQNYKNQKNIFPPTLDQFSPDYLSSIPQPNLSRNYCYASMDDGQSFTLAFTTRGGGWYIYSSKDDKGAPVDSGFWGKCYFLLE
jgi:hypothetical protein